MMCMVHQFQASRMHTENAKCSNGFQKQKGKEEKCHENDHQDEEVATK